MESAGPKNSTEYSWWNSIKKHFPWKEFMVGAVTPIVIYYLFHLNGQPLTGALVASSWGVGVVLFTHFVFRKVNLFAILSIPLTLIEIIGTLITLSHDFYLATSAIDHLLWGTAFLLSLTFPRPLILIFADAAGGIPNTAEMEEFRKTKEFKSAWVMLTLIWSGTHFVSAMLLVAAQLLMPLEFFLVLRTALNMPLIAVLIALSFWFPDWYWERNDT